MSAWGSNPGTPRSKLKNKTAPIRPRGIKTPSQMQFANTQQEKKVEKAGGYDMHPGVKKGDKNQVG